MKKLFDFICDKDFMKIVSGILLGFSISGMISAISSTIYPLFSSLFEVLNLDNVALMNKSFYVSYNYFLVPVINLLLTMLVIIGGIWIASFNKKKQQ